MIPIKIILYYNAEFLFYIAIHLKIIDFLIFFDDLKTIKKSYNVQTIRIQIVYPHPKKQNKYWISPFKMKTCKRYCSCTFIKIYYENVFFYKIAVQLSLHFTSSRDTTNFSIPIGSGVFAGKGGPGVLDAFRALVVIHILV